MVGFNPYTNGAQIATCLGGFDRFWGSRLIPTPAFASGYTAVP